MRYRVAQSINPGTGFIYAIDIKLTKIASLLYECFELTGRASLPANSKIVRALYKAEAGLEQAILETKKIIKGE